MRTVALVATALLLPLGAVGAAPPAERLKYGPTAAWVMAPPPATRAVAPADAPLRYTYSDQQIRIGAGWQENYGAFRLHILKPEALPIGNVALTWDPSGGSATVHYLRIIRDQQIIDVLKNQRFQVLRREASLEQSMLDGMLTATLQTSDLRVGDELEFAATTIERDPTFGDHAFGAAELPKEGMPGVFRFVMNWPTTKPLTWRATRDLPQSPSMENGGQTRLVYELRDPGGAIINEQAPSRHNVRRLIEFSDFAGWTELSRRVAVLYENASQLSMASPLKAEAAKIANVSTDPVERTQAALRLVQDQVRYVYVGLDGGNYKPSPADLTWQRRFGDCKAKTALLLALLRELNIDAEAVLINSGGGDGLNARLPSPGVFDHVLVRAKVGGRSYWLDGTRMGDRYLDMLPPASFRWFLPVRTKGSELEAVPLLASERPQIVQVMDIDARAGFLRPAIVRASHVLNGDAAFNARSGLATLNPEDIDRRLRRYWREQVDWVEADRVDWQFDERHKTLAVKMEGTGKPIWEGDDQEGRHLTIADAGFPAPEMRRRSKEQDRSAPWITDFQSFACYATTIRLPAQNARWRWGYRARPMDLHLGGVAYWRMAGLKDDVLRIVMSQRLEQPEISAEQAAAVNEAIPSFDNKMSRVYQLATRPSIDQTHTKETLPFGESVNWLADFSMCSSPLANALPSSSSTGDAHPSSAQGS